MEKIYDEVIKNRQTPGVVDPEEIKRIAYLIFERRKAKAQAGDPFSVDIEEQKQQLLDQGKPDTIKERDYQIAQAWLHSPYKDILIGKAADELSNLRREQEKPVKKPHISNK